MSKRTFVLAAVILVAVTLSLSAQEDGRYLDTENGFSIVFPNGWTAMESPPPGTVVAALSPLDGPTDTFPESINVVVEDLPQDMTTDEYGLATKAMLKGFLRDFRVLDEGTLQIDGRQAGYIDYSMTFGEYSLHNIAYYLVAGRKAYVVTCGGTPESFDASKDAFEKTAASFKVAVAAKKSDDAAANSSPTTLEEGRYVNRQNGFSIAFPEGWTLREKPALGVLISALSPVNDPTDTFAENINVVIEVLPRDATTAEYGAAARENFAKAVQGFKVLHKGTLEIDGRQAEYFTYTMPYGEYSLHNIVYYCVVERKTYIITCSAVEDSFDAFKDTFEKAAASFKLETAAEKRDDLREKAQDKDIRADMTKYTSSAYAFSVSFPDDWTVTDRGITSAVIAVSPSEGETDKYSESVTISVEIIAKGTTLESYGKSLLKTLERRSALFELLENTPAKISGLDGARIVYTAKMGPYKFTTTLHYAISGSSAYLISGGAPNDSYDRYRDTFEAIAKSFALEPAPE